MAETLAASGRMPDVRAPHRWYPSRDGIEHSAARIAAAGGQRIHGPM
jgi:hypothetical protein